MIYLCVRNYSFSDSFFYDKPISLLLIWHFDLYTLSHENSSAEIPSAPFLSLSVVSNSEVQVAFDSPLSDGGAAINSYEVLSLCICI